MNIPRRISATMLYLGAVAAACSLSGCTAMGNVMSGLANCFEFRHELKQDMHQERQDLRQELVRVRQQERLKLQEAMLAEERANLAQLKQCLPETAPFTETTIALPLQQKYVFGPPELEVKEMEEMIKAQKQGLEERMEQWRKDMKAYHDRKAFHDKNENSRVENFRNNPPSPFTDKKCGCQQALVSGHCCCAVEEKGQCGCEQALRCGHCCCRRNCNEEKTCEYAPLKKQPFTEKPPEMPRENILASELPIKMRVKVLQEVGESRVTKVRTGRAPLQERPRQPFKDQCYPGGECVDGVPCDKPLGESGSLVPSPPPPVVSEEVAPDIDPARRSAPKKVAVPPTPPPEARAPKASMFNIFGKSATAGVNESRLRKS